ncbi:reprolysin-like metallopeptidase [Chryseobacterium bernardetii]|uniref:reprolysin-like metallopeptidase n=1 Tax=Chryseobacterium bernardetii TaxID=1241978 RepID=UPI00301B5393
MKLKLTFIFVCASFFLNAQISNTSNLRAESLPGTIFKFNIENFKKSVKGNREKSDRISNQLVNLTLIDGRSQEFILFENNLLSKRLDGIIAFDGYSKDKKSKIKLTLAGDKMTAMIKSGNGYFIVEPYKTEKGEYRVYNSFEMFGETFNCKVKEDEFKENLQTIAEKLNIQKSVTNFPYGNIMRVYRLAVATTGEFTSAFGNQDAALGEVVSMVNLINQIYESELSISFQLIEKTLNKTLIFTDGSTDPFTVNPNFASSTNSQSGFNTMNANGTLVQADYDIGHTFNIMPGTVGGSRGEAAPQPCNAPIKARAWSEWVITAPKSMTANLIVHEMGHQFGAGHTFNAMGGYPSYPEACTDAWSFNSAVEPGAGSTIMGYGTNCTTPIDQTNSGRNKLDYFHARSLDQILNTLKLNSTCYNSVTLSNTPPLASAGNIAISIPKNTPFKLKGIGSDVEDLDLSYTWDQTDIATVYDKGALGSIINGLAGYSAANSTTAPLFRSEQTTKTTERYFPKMKFVLENQNTPPVNAAEVLSLVPRTIKMRFTVRDNSVVSGGVDSDQVLVTVTDQGPLAVTYPNTNVILSSGANVNISWSVNQTDVLKNTVNILLSTDGGVTFPHILASDIPNNGFATVTLPPVVFTDRARIKVTAVLNEFAEFFDVSDTNFIIDSDCKAFPSVIVETVKEVTAIQGSSGANLNLQPQTPSNQTYNTKSLDFFTSNMIPLPLYIYNQAMTSPYAVLTSTDLLPVRFKVTESGPYTLSWTGPKIIVPTVYKGNQVSSPNFISSTGIYSGAGTSFSFLGYLSANLEKGVEYYMTVKNIYGVPIGQSAELSIDGAGQFYNIIDIPSGINYTYIAINTSTNSVVKTSSTADFTTLPIGNYKVYGISFTGAENNLMYKTIAELNQTGICYQLSLNNIILKITSTLAINEVKKKQIEIVPNPVKDILTVEGSNKVTHYEIYDLSGKLMESNLITVPKINLSKFTTGIYMLRLWNNRTLVYQSKFIKE